MQVLRRKKDPVNNMHVLLQAIRRLNSKLMEDERVHVSVLANSDGLSLVVKKE